MGYIYRIINNVNGKTYIGCSENYKRRWKEHIATLERYGGCPALKSAMLKYGIENFKFEVMIICFDGDMEFYEPAYIKKYDTIVPNGYNISPGGKATYGFKGKTHSGETKKKISDYFKEKYKDTTYRNMLIAKAKERMTHPEAREKIRQGLLTSERFSIAMKVMKEEKKGCYAEKTDKLCNLISKGMKKYHISVKKENPMIEHNIKNQGKIVIQYTKDNKFLERFRSIGEASRKSGYSKSRLAHILHGRIKQSEEFTWKFEETIII
jgi:group I intron endonuclease